MNGSDSASPSTTFATELNGGNYADWRFRMQMLLVRIGLWDVVSGDLSRPGDDDSSGQRQWDQRSLLAMAEISERLSDVDVVHIRRCATARDAWEQLAAMYEPSGLACQVFLSRELNHLRMQETDSPREHFARFLSLAEQLGTAGQPVADDELAWTMLTSLPLSYATLVEELTKRKNDVTIALVMSSVLREDARRRLEGASPDCEPPKGASQYDDIIRPFFAPSLPAPELPSRFSATSLPTSDTSLFMGAPQPHESHAVTEEGATSSVRIYFPLSGPFSRDGWYLHSSATHHVTPKRASFIRFEEIPPEDITIAGKTYEAIGSGDTRVVWATGEGDSHRVLMRNVLYVPAAPASFVAVNPLVAKGLAFAFRDGHCIIEAQPGIAMGRAIREGGTYRLLTQ